MTRVDERALSVVATDGDAVLPPALAAYGARLVRASDAASPRAVDEAVGADDVLWLPRWTRCDERLLEVVQRWRAAGTAGGPRVACVRLRLHAPRASVVLPERRVVLSSAGGATLASERAAPRPRAALEELPEPWDVDLPATLSEHVQAMNAQTSVAARLRDAAGLVASWRDLTVRPAALVARALLAVRGSRRAALPRVAVEAYREVLVAAKLWERAHERSAAT